MSIFYEIEFAKYILPYLPFVSKATSQTAFGGQLPYEGSR